VQNDSMPPAANFVSLLPIFPSLCVPTRHNTSLTIPDPKIATVVGKLRRQSALAGASCQIQFNCCWFALVAAKA
jgi:hypothetical protein